jgi:hypothetical protein
MNMHCPLGHSVGLFRMHDIQKRILWSLVVIIIVIIIYFIAIYSSGKVVLDSQDPDGGYAINTSVTETDRHLYIGSLVAPVLGRIDKEKIGL